ncbi:MAG TPA: GWxTD domain-containing protein [Pyrinomonadaceae bacterium]|jgi:GWxTD domain-containing protein
MRKQLLRRIFLYCLAAALVLSSVISYGQSNERDKYHKWLNEDVAYIITPDEKQRFLELKTDEEREQYVVAFWQRRDPDADTEENEYRDEHYERVTYANSNFTFGDMAGWRTDRGRTHILHSEPHEKQNTSSGEIWKYRYIPGVGADIEFEFIDLSGTGDLRLIRQP